MSGFCVQRAQHQLPFPVHLLCCDGVTGEAPRQASLVSSGYKDEQDDDSLVGRQCPVLLALWGGLGACSQGLLESLALPGLGRDKDPSFTLET